MEDTFTTKIDAMYTQHKTQNSSTFIPVNREIINAYYQWLSLAEEARRSRSGRAAVNRNIAWIRLSELNDRYGRGYRLLDTIDHIFNRQGNNYKTAV